MLARGDRRLGKLLETVMEKGARLDAWDEYFKYETWLDAFTECGIDPDHYTVRGYGEEELLPWAIVSDGVQDAYLRRERSRAYASETTPDCRTQCSACGANCLLKGGKCDG